MLPPNLLSPVLIALLLLPGWGFAAMVLFMGGVPGEWARVALTVWTALAAAVLAGSLLADGGMVPVLLALALGFAAVMTGGPWGLALAALAALPLLAGTDLRLMAVLLALPPAVSALQQILWR